MRHVMRSLVLLGLGLVILASASSADEIYIPNNQPSVGGSNSWPFNTYTAWRYHLLIPAKMLGGKPFKVKDLAIAPSQSGSGTWKATQMQVRIAHTTATSLSPTFAANLGASPTVLHDGAISFSWAGNQWSPLGISRRFHYDGTSSLVLEVRYTGGPGGAGGISVRTDASLERCYTHTSGSSNPYTATTCIVPVPGPMMGMKVRITTVNTLIVGSGTGKIGTVVDLDLTSPPWPGETYQVGTALGPGPTPIGKFILGLDVDNLLVLSVQNLVPSIFRGYVGKLDAQGNGKAAIGIPKASVLIGLRLYSAFVVVKPGLPSGIADISDTFMFTIS